MKDIRLSEELLLNPIARELKEKLQNILADTVIEHHELEELNLWVQQHMEHSDDIPAIDHLNWLFQNILADQEIASLEWSMLRSSVAKILPEKVQPQELSSEKITLPERLSSHSCVNPDDEWVIIDTETSGLSAPIYAVEIAAQRMRGWKPLGESFRVLLNHDVELEPRAVATHGYTREFLRKNGVQPVKAYVQLAEYANGLSMVSHNLSYDFNRVLEPEWKRLNIPRICNAGFCTVMLSRRCLPQISSAALASLSKQFNLGEPSHQAGEDVRITVKLFSDVLAPKLIEAGIHTFQQAKDFSRKTPLSECRKLFPGVFIKPKPRVKRPSYNRDKTRRFRLFLSCLNLTAGHAVANDELDVLQQWFETEGCLGEAAYAADLVEGILADGQVTAAELVALNAELEMLVLV